MGQETRTIRMKPAGPLRLAPQPDQSGRPPIYCDTDTQELASGADSFQVNLDFALVERSTCNIQLSWVHYGGLIPELSWRIDGTDVQKPSMPGIASPLGGAIVTATTLDPGNHTITLAATGWSVFPDESSGTLCLCVVVIVGTNTEDNCITFSGG